MNYNEQNSVPQHISTESNLGKHNVPQVTHSYILKQSRDGEISYTSTRSDKRLGLLDSTDKTTANNGRFETTESIATSHNGRKSEVLSTIERGSNPMTIEKMSSGIQKLREDTSSRYIKITNLKSIPLVKTATNFYALKTHLSPVSNANEHKLQSMNKAWYRSSSTSSQQPMLSHFMKTQSKKNSTNGQTSPVVNESDSDESSVSINQSKSVSTVILKSSMSSATFESVASIIYQSALKTGQTYGSKKTLATVFNMQSSFIKGSSSYVKIPKGSRFVITYSIRKADTSVMKFNKTEPFLLALKSKKGYTKRTAALTENSYKTLTMEHDRMMTSYFNFANDNKGEKKVRALATSRAEKKFTITTHSNHRFFTVFSGKLKSELKYSDEFDDRTMRAVTGASENVESTKIMLNMADSTMIDLEVTTVPSKLIAKSQLRTETQSVLNADAKASLPLRDPMNSNNNGPTTMTLIEISNLETFNLKMRKADAQDILSTTESIQNENYEMTKLLETYESAASNDSCINDTNTTSKAHIQATESLTSRLETQDGAGIRLALSNATTHESFKHVAMTATSNTSKTSKKLISSLRASLKDRKSATLQSEVSISAIPNYTVPAHIKKPCSGNNYSCFRLPLEQIEEVTIKAGDAMGTFFLLAAIVSSLVVFTFVVRCLTIHT